jgi:ankyrin repeat protein
MQILSLHSAVVFSGLAACALAVAQPARAQVGMMDPSGALQRRAAQAPDGSKPKIAPPPALPGTAKPSESPAPPTQIPMDMSPNDALFDAINRGDMEGARDALSRGADLGSRNILGMTPLELSVDLGRNDISFLLLSYRNGGDTSRSTAQAKAPPPSKASEARQTARTHHRVEPVKVAAPPAPQKPRLFANDGGAPVPAAGFLGFDSGRTAQ